MDGITHINVYSKGKTLIGKWLSNFTYSPIDLPNYDNFNSVEGFWYWLCFKQKTGLDDLKLRTLIGASAKSYGREILKDPKDNVPIPEHSKKILLEAIRVKIRTYSNTWKLITDTHPLPFMHYYVLPDGRVQDLTKKYQWIMDELSIIRDKLIIHFDRDKIK